MIDHLCGELVRREAEKIILRANGVGFELDVPTGSYSDVLLGDFLEVPTKLVFRQDGFALFGFANATEREFFTLLTGITGIGPKSALGILGSSTPSQLADAIISEDISALVQVKGIGKKGAKRIIVELAEKIRALKPQGSGVKAEDESLFSSVALQDAMEVLLSLGCAEQEAQTALEAVRDRVDLDEEDAADHLVMFALKALGGK